MMSPDTLEGVCRDYLNTVPVRTLIGFCACLGVTPHKLQSLFEEPDPQHPESLAILGSTLMHIEAATVESGLTESFNSAMAKFVLSAYHNRNEKKLHESQTDSVHRIIVETRQPVDLDELKEYQRLEGAIEEMAENERVALGTTIEEAASIHHETEKEAMARLRVEEIERDNIAHPDALHQDPTLYEI